MVFDVRCIVLRLRFGKYFFYKYIWRHIKLSECSSMLMTCAAYESGLYSNASAFALASANAAFAFALAFECPEVGAFAFALAFES